MSKPVSSPTPAFTPTNAPAYAPLYQQLQAHVKKRLTQQRTQGRTLQIVGIVSGGAWLADALQADLQLDAIGHITSAMHRDDFAQRGLSGSGQTTLPFEINGAHIMLLDDVLHTGRTIRAVLNELFDYGRPASVELAVLVDRQGHQLPIQADFAAATIALASHQSLALRQRPNGELYFITEVTTQAQGNEQHTTREATT